MRSDRGLKLWAGWLHLVEGATQDSIATRLGMTWAKVNRYVAACREKGLVRVSVDTGLRFCFEAESALVARYGLAAAYVVPIPAAPEATASVVGAAAGAFVSAQLQSGQTPSLGWGQTLDASVRGLEPRSASGNVIVGLMGGLPRAGSINPQTRLALSSSVQPPANPMPACGTARRASRAQSAMRPEPQPTGGKFAVVRHATGTGHPMRDWPVWGAMRGWLRD